MKQLAIILAIWLSLAGVCLAQTFPDDWAGYIEATADAPAGSLTDFVYIIQIDSTNTDFWSNVRSDGGDIRVTIDGTQVPVDPMTDIAVWNYAGESAVIACKRSGAASTAPVIRVYAGCPSATLPAASDTYGQDNAYPSHWRAFYPLGGGNDRTSYNNDLTMAGSPTVGGASGPISGSLATDYNGTSQYGTATASVPTASPIVILAVANSDNNTSAKSIASVADTAVNNHYFVMQDRGADSGDPVYATTAAGGFAFAQSASGFTTATWQSRVAAFNSTTSRYAGINGVLGTQNTTSISPTSIDTIAVGAWVTTSPSQHYDGKLSFVRLHTDVLSANWIAYDAAMLADPDQSDFYNGWTANFSSGGSPKISPALLNSVIQ